MKQGIKNILIVLALVLACFVVALSVNAQPELKMFDKYEKKFGFVEEEIYLGRQVIAHSGVEMRVNDKNDTTYYFLMKKHNEIAYFTIPDITELLDAIRILNSRVQSGEYIGNNSFVLGKNEFLDRKDWYIILNSKTSIKFYFVTSIDVFKFNLQQAAIVLLDYQFGYARSTN